MSTRRAAVAGLFYPGEALACQQAVDALLAANPAQGPSPKALIVPHAGYIYSGPAAACAYNLLRVDRDTIRQVVLLGPNHRVPLDGIAMVSVDDFATPLGRIKIDKSAQARIADLPQVRVNDFSHAMEHSLEVHLPFLQRVLDDFTMVPLLVGDCAPSLVAEVIALLWGDHHTRFIISSDMSHFHSYAVAQQCDQQTARQILAKQTTIAPEQACGCRAINGFNDFLQRHPLAVDLIALNNSGDTAGDKNRVVGYAAFSVH